MTKRVSSVTGFLVLVSLLSLLVGGGKNLGAAPSTALRVSGFSKKAPDLFFQGQILAESDSVASGYAQLLKDPASPIFITPDLAFEQTHVFFSKALEAAETERISPALTAMLTAYGQAITTAIETEKNPELIEILKHNQRYIQTALCLMGKDPAPKDGPVADELALILEAKQVTNSPVLGYKEDYSQYVPRGAYSRSEARRQYFQTMMWLGRMGFYLEPNPTASLDESLAQRLTAQGVVFTAIAAQTPAVSQAMNQLDSLLTRWLGQSDDLTLAEVKPFLVNANDPEWAIETILGDANSKNDDKSHKESKPFSTYPVINLSEVISLKALTEFRATFRTKARHPRILSTFAEEGRQHPPMSIRLVGQRFLMDSYVLQSFTFDKVQTHFGTEPEKPFTLSLTRDGRKVRGVPRAYDVMAHLGSPEALKQLLLDGDLDYTGYRDQMKRLDQERSQLSSPATFYNRYLSAVSENLVGTHYGNSIPNLRLTSSVGAWVSLRHDVVAYAKQSYTSVGRGFAMSPPLPSRVPVMRVAPAAPVFRHLGQAIRLILPTFENESSHRQLLAGQQLLETLDLLERTAGTGPLTETDALQLAKAIRDWAGGPPQTLIADVHTDANSNEVLEVGVGQSATLSFEDGDQGQPSKGVVFSVYEFRWPLSQRLTDEAWREMLKQKAGSLRKLTFFLSPLKSTNTP